MNTFTPQEEYKIPQNVIDVVNNMIPESEENKPYWLKGKALTEEEIEQNKVIRQDRIDKILSSIDNLKQSNELLDSGMNNHYIDDEGKIVVLN